MALLSAEFINAVVALGKRKPDGTVHWIGTGFIYGRFSPGAPEGQKSYKAFLVTNKHVIEGETQLVIGANPAASEENVRQHELLLHNKQGESMVALSADADVAAVPIPIQRLEGIDASFIRGDDFCLSMNGMRDEGVAEGDSVFVLGFPMGLVDSRPSAIVRTGCIARIRDLLSGRSNKFLVDASVFPGNSGGPVVLKPEVVATGNTQAHPNTRIIGIVSAYVPYEDYAISAQTGKPRVVFTENSGLTLVHPMDYVAAVVEQAYENQCKWLAVATSGPAPTDLGTRPPAE